MPALAELKSISAGPTRYPRGNRDKGADRRARLLQGEYRKKAVDVDRDVLGTRPGDTGPVQRRLESYGPLISLVSGAWGEGSADLHGLVQTIAEARLEKQGLARGRQGSEAELGILVGQVRRSLSITAVRAQAEMLLNRLSNLGPGARMAARRREWVRRREEVMRGERQAQWVANICGRGIVRQGRFMRP